MNQFQTQNQWENESDNIVFDKNTSDSSSRKVSVYVKKSSLILIITTFIVVIAIILSIYIFARPIEGVWIRQQDDNSTLAGMTVEVKKNNGSIDGTIIAMPEGAETFEVGQVKWFNMKKVGFGVYQGQSLGAYEDTGGCVYHYDNNVSTMTILHGGDKLTLVSPDVEKGGFQIWIKQK